MSEERESIVHAIAAQTMGLSADDSEAFRTIGMALRQIADAGVDSGLGLGGADFWLKIGGVEYWCCVKRSATQSTNT